MLLYLLIAVVVGLVGVAELIEALPRVSARVRVFCFVVCGLLWPLTCVVLTVRRIPKH